MKTLIHTLLFLLLACATVIAQEKDNPNPLLQKGYEQLDKEYYKYEMDLQKARGIATASLQKAKKEKDSLYIAKSYYALFFIDYRDHRNPNEVVYLDSVIDYAKNLKNSDLLCKSYLNKGGYYHYKRNFTMAINFFTLAYNEAQRTNNSYLLNDARHDIAALKRRMGDYEESQAMFKICADYSLKRNDIEDYLNSLISISDSYTLLKKYKESSAINQKGYELAVKNNSIWQHYFTLQEAINSYYLKKYKESIFTIEKTLPYYISVDDKPNQAVCYFYLGMNHYTMGHQGVAVSYFKKVDAIFKKTNDLYPETRPTYELLIDYYKASGDTKNQLYYIEQLLKLDRVLDTNYKYLSQKINNDYDTPQLLMAKQAIINELNHKQVAATLKIIILAFLLLCLLLLCLYYYRKQKRYRKNFEKLLEDKATNPPIVDAPVPAAPPTQKEVSTPVLNLDNRLVNELLEKLRLFEKNLGFLSNTCTIGTLAKEFKTNPNYLSKVINVKKQTSFTVYINNLRIDYAVDQLKNSTKFNRYTIEGIAESVGFNASQAFSNAFFNKTGIRPSYFINELKGK
jgi:AraC-like DNA-binding protein